MSTCPFPEGNDLMFATQNLYLPKFVHIVTTPASMLAYKRSSRNGPAKKYTEAKWESYKHVIINTHAHMQFSAYVATICMSIYYTVHAYFQNLFVLMEMYMSIIFPCLKPCMCGIVIDHQYIAHKQHCETHQQHIVIYNLKHNHIHCKNSLVISTTVLVQVIESSLNSRDPTLFCFVAISKGTLMKRS